MTMMFLVGWIIEYESEKEGGEKERGRGESEEEGRSGREEDR